MAANDCHQISQCRLFIFERNTSVCFLVDTGADVCVFPLKLVSGKRNLSKYELSAANNTNIATYGTITMTLNLGLRREFTWRFIIANVNVPIIGADFLAHFGLLPDLTHKQLIDSTTSLTVNGKVSKCDTLTIKTITGSTIFHELLKKFPDITRPLGVPKIIKHNTRHHILTTPGPPVALKPRRLAPEKLDIAKKEFNSMVSLGLARPSKSMWAAPLHLVQKHNEEWRPCGDYRGLNARTYPDKYPVRHIEDFTNTLDECTIFSSIDLVKAFNQVPVAAEDIEKTAITTPFGLFEFPFMTFGLRNAAQTFQRFVDEILRGLNFCFAYIDDILVASKSIDEHKKHLEIIFKRLAEYGVVINSNKCKFGLPEVKFLGYMVSAKGIQPLPEKVEIIREYPQPKTIKELRRFLGMINFYRRFIPKAAEAQVPLNNLLIGNVNAKTQINWTSDTMAAFELCKEILASATMLVHPKVKAPLALFCDASDNAIGAALQQRVNDTWQPLNFFSRKLRPAEQKYAAYDRELLAIYAAVKHFSHMIEGRTFIIYTDHKPLSFAFRHKDKQISPRQFRHLDFIGQFTTDIRHISGSENVVADALSRIETIQQGINYQHLAESQFNDSEMNQFLKKESVLQLKQIQMPQSNTVVWCDVSTNTARPFLTQPFRKIAFNMVHGLSHPGAKATVRLMTQKFVWPSIKADCREWVKTCGACQKSKITRHVHAPIGSFPLPSARFQHVHLDIVVMPYSEGFRYCLTMVDRFTRWPEAVPLQDQEAVTICRALYETWVARFGVPLTITTDQGRQFESCVFRHLNELLGSKHIHTTAYHPAANGMVERFHRQLKAALKCHDDTWTKALPIVLLGIRNAFKEDINASAAEMLYGQPLCLPGEFMTTTKDVPNAESFVKELRGHFKTVKPVEGSRHGETKIFVFKQLSTCNYVYVRHDASKVPLQKPYSGPHKVISRCDRFFVVDINGKQTTVSIDRLKPAYTEQDVPDEPVPGQIIIQRSTINNHLPSEESATHASTTSNTQPNLTVPPEDTATYTRYGRRVRFPNRFQAGFS